MTEKLFPEPVLKHLHDDPLKPFLDCFETSLSDRGYTRTVIKEKLRSVTDFREWLYQQHFELNELSDRLIDVSRGRYRPDDHTVSFLKGL
jgi:hypothetical protein